MTFRDRHALYPGTWPRNNPSAPSPEAVMLATRFSLLTIGAGTGSTRLDELYAAAATAGVPMNLFWYMKSPGVHDPAVNPTADSTYGFAALQSGGHLARVSYPSGSFCLNLFSNPRWYYVNILNSGSLAFWIANQVALATQMHAERALEGCYLDNSSTLLSSYVTPGLPGGYSDSSWYAAIRSVVAGLAAGMPTKRILCNSYAGYGAVGERGLELLDVASGLVWEGFAWKAGSPFDFWARDRFVSQITDARTGLARGRDIIALDYVTTNDYPRRLFRLGAWLLIYDGTSHLKEQSDVGQLFYALEYDEPVDALGTPGSAFTDDGNTVQRNYQNGRVYVNPGTAAVNVTLPWPMEKLTLRGTLAWNDAQAGYDWVPVSGTVQVNAHEALIVRNALAVGSGRVEVIRATRTVTAQVTPRVDALVRVTNTGPNAWAAQDHHLTARVFPANLAAGDGDALVSASMPALAPGAAALVPMTITPSAEVGDTTLFAPDSTIVIDVAQASTAVGDPPGFFYIGQANGNLLGRPDRLGLELNLSSTVGISTSGAGVTALNPMVPAQTEYQFTQFEFTVSSSATVPYLVTLIVTRVGAGGSQTTAPYATYQFTRDQSLIVSCDLRLGAGEQLKIVAASNSRGGTMTVRARGFQLPLFP